MKIIRGEAWVLRMRMAEPYAIAYASSDTAVNVFLRLETENGLLGYGCGAPDVNVTGETPEAVLGMLLQHVLPALTGVDPLRPVFAQKLLDPFLSSFPSAKHAVDMALFDILGKVAGVPAWKLLGGFRDKILTSVTVGILPEKETVERAREWVSQGFSCLKIKGGKDWEEDASRILKVREAVGEGVRLRFDANQGFSTSQAISFANKTKRVQLECLEQPTSAEDWKELRKVN